MSVNAESIRHVIYLALIRTMSYGCLSKSSVFFFEEYRINKCRHLLQYTLSCSLSAGWYAGPRTVFSVPTIFITMRTPYQYSIKIILLHCRAIDTFLIKLTSFFEGFFSIVKKYLKHTPPVWVTKGLCGACTH